MIILAETVLELEKYFNKRYNTKFNFYLSPESYCSLKVYSEDFLWIDYKGKPGESIDKVYDSICYMYENKLKSLAKPELDKTSDFWDTF